MKKTLSIFISFIFLITLISCKKFELTITGPNEVEVGQTITLEHNFEGPEKVNWTVDNPNIATVYNGVVTGISEGTVQVKAFVKDYIATYEVNVLLNNINFMIIGTSTAEIGNSYKFTIESDVVYKGEIKWESSDTNIATISSYGTFYAKSLGEVTITATIKDKFTQAMKVTVVPKKMPSINVTCPTQLEVGERAKVTIGLSNPSLVDTGGIRYSLSETGIIYAYGATHDLQIEGRSVGTVSLIFTFGKYPEYKKEIVIEVVPAKPKNIVIDTKEEMKVGEFTNIKAVVDGVDSNEIIWSVSDPSMAIIEDGEILALRSGTVNVTAKPLENLSISATQTITISKNESLEYTEEELKLAEEILKKMNLSQKVGQMFAIGFSGTNYTSTLDSVIKNYNFGNVIYMGANVADPTTIAKMSNDIQNTVMSVNGIPAFITIDQEGGRVVRLTNGGTQFLSNMAMCATGDVNNTYLEGLAVAKELRNYGINVDFAPVLDVNNNPDNPIIGNRSYSDNPFLVAKYGVNMIKGLKEGNVMATSKHFPGHGNTSVDSHTGLPVITSTKEELYQTELAPFIASVSNGIDAIMTTHIIFTAIDSELPATLSNKVLTELLRDEIGYEGLIVTDGMEMGALQTNFGDTSSLALQAVKAGVDILLYTSNTTPRTAHSAIVNAVTNGQISEERINESVKRIILKKIKYGLFDNYLAPNADITELLKENEKLNNDFAIQGLTQVLGTFDGFTKDDKILIISPKCNYNLGTNLDDNSLGCYASVYLKAQGYNCDYYTINENASNSQISEINSIISNYDKIVIATSNVKTKSYTSTAKLVKQVLINKPDTLVIALDTPYDYLSFNSYLTNYVCVYSYQKATVEAITKYLNKEFEATGKAPVAFK